jgi:hypothetical protein
MKKKDAIEITTFKLAGYTCRDFIAANADIDEWLQQQPGFKSRRIAEWSDGTIVDMLIWDDAANGRNAMHRLMDEMADSPVHAMIDHSTVSWNVATVQHEL